MTIQHVYFLPFLWVGVSLYGLKCSNNCFVGQVGFELAKLSCLFVFPRDQDSRHAPSPLTYNIFSFSVCMCMWVYIPVHVHMEEARVNVGCLLSFSTFFLETGSLAECGACLLARLAGEQAPGFSCLWMPVLWFQGLCCYALGFMWVWGSPNSGSCARIASTSASEPPSYPVILHHIWTFRPVHLIWKWLCHYIYFMRLYL